MSELPIHFFIGKGGVGKSTTSALTAVHLAATGRRTLLVSMDPAHNQCDIFGMRFSGKSRPVAPNLAVREIDTEYWIRRYLKETRNHLKRTYAYQSAFNLQDHFNVLQYAPGLEEYALLLAFEDVIQAAGGQDAIVFDMAPTALSLRFFSLPSISLVWLDELLKLRGAICDKKEIISKIKMGACEFETDRVRKKLDELIASHTRLKSRFMSTSTHVNLVLNNDRLSLSEARRIERRLAGIDIPISRIVVNKMGPEETPDDIAEIFPTERLSMLPLVPGGILGLEGLEQVVAGNAGALCSIAEGC
ncbi:ArsA family ATPase [Desulfosarcina widdelii]|nr:ArsA family ATPase [Desulfosarcina widdelii]